VLASNLGQDVIYLEDFFFMIFVSPSTDVLECYLKLGRIHFRPHTCTLQFEIPGLLCGVVEAFALFRNEGIEFALCDL